MVFWSAELVDRSGHSGIIVWFCLVLAAFIDSRRFAALRVTFTRYNAYYKQWVSSLTQISPPESAIALSSCTDTMRVHQERPSKRDGTPDEGESNLSTLVAHQGDAAGRPAKRGNMSIRVCPVSELLKPVRKSKRKK